MHNKRAMAMRVSQVGSFGWLLILLLLASFPPGHEAADCGDWLPFNNDELCFKFFPGSLKNFSEASAFCELQATNNYKPGLATVKTAKAQEVLAELLFANEDVFDNVWLGSAFSEANKRFEWWDDGTPLTPYNNWAPNYPRDINETDRCVEIRSPNSKLGKGPRVGGAQWYDVRCGKSNLVVCQRQPAWTMEEIVSEIIELRKQVVPVGFLYTEYPGSPNPRQIWPELTWQDVSEQYAGTFFRVVGAEAGDWGEVQGPCAPRLSHVAFADHAGDTTNLQLPESGWSAWVRGGSWSGWSHVGTSHRYHYAHCEVRPRNLSVRLWKRTM